MIKLTLHQTLIELPSINMLKKQLELQQKSTAVKMREHLLMKLQWQINTNRLLTKMLLPEQNIILKMLKITLHIDNGFLKIELETGLKLNLKLQILAEVPSIKVFQMLQLQLLINKNKKLNQMPLLQNLKQMQKLLPLLKKTELLLLESIKLEIMLNHLEIQEAGDQYGQSILYPNKNKALQMIAPKLEEQLLKTPLIPQEFKEQLKLKQQQQLLLVTLNPQKNQVSTQQILNNKLTMLEEVEFKLLEILLDGECKQDHTILSTRQVMNHMLQLLLNQTSSIKVMINRTSNGEHQFIPLNIAYLHI